MSDYAIRTEDLGKRYRVGQYVGYQTLRESLVNVFTAPFRRSRSKETNTEDDSRDSDSEYIWAVRNCSLEVRQGDVLGIIGPNGSGKTTVLKLLSRITNPTEGYAEIRGRVRPLLEVGTGFHPELTGRENIYLNGAVLGMKKKEIDLKFDEIVSFAEVATFIDTPLKRYSSGMQVRLAFSIAAHLEPEILLVDEVLAVGDAAFQKKCLGKMGDITEGGRTVLFVSHNMGVVQRLCQKVVWLDKGRVKDIGDSATICDKYLHSDVGFGSGVYNFDDRAKHVVHFLHAELLNSKGKPSSTFRADEPITFRITYRIAQELSGVSVALNITDALGGSLWAMSDLDVYPELFEKRQAGTWVYECIAPANVLRPGTYMLALGAGSGSQYYHHPPPFPFEINASGYWRASQRYFGIAGGPVAVPMEIKKPKLVD
jgi:lipopolysaccharide transport system ATP-binding protein